MIEIKVRKQDAVSGQRMWLVTKLRAKDLRAETIPYSVSVDEINVNEVRFNNDTLIPLHGVKFMTIKATDEDSLGDIMILAEGIAYTESYLALAVFRCELAGNILHWQNEIQRNPTASRYELKKLGRRLREQHHTIAI